MTSPVINYSTDTRENVIYLFSTIKIQMFIEGFLGHQERKRSDVDLTPSVCPLIDQGKQPMKMHTKVTLLYNNS